MVGAAVGGRDWSYLASRAAKLQRLCGIAMATVLVLLPRGGDAHLGPEIDVPELLETVLIDGDLSEWEDFAWTDGTWDLARVQAQAYTTSSSTLLDSGGEPPGTPFTAEDLSAEYFLAWHAIGMFFGVRAVDNVHDISSPSGSPAEWQQRDSVAFAFDSRHDGDGNRYRDGDHIFVFVADPSGRSGSVWWRLGESSGAQELTLSRSAAVAVRFDPDDQRSYVIEALVPFTDTFNLTDPAFFPRAGVRVGFSLIHSDSDGGQFDFGGQWQLYGVGSDDGRWGDYILTETLSLPQPVETTAWATVKQLFRPGAPGR